MGRRALIVSILMIAAGLILAACDEDDPAKAVDQGDELLAVTFDDAGTWETGIFPAGEIPTSTLAIRDGRYIIDHNAPNSASFIWGMGGEELSEDEGNGATNVIIEVETEQLSAEKDTIYGVLCRLGVDSRENVTGYALLISGDGHYGIAELRSNNLSFLLDWHQTDAIHQGAATNTIRAICVDDYLALYVNDTFLGDTTDTMYMSAGPVGLLAGVTEGGSVSIAFDNLAVYEGSLGN